MMTREEALEHLETCIRQDRACVLNYLDSLMTRQIYSSALVEAERQKYRDVTAVQGFPDIDYPLVDAIPMNHMCAIKKGRTLTEMTTDRPNKRRVHTFG